MQRTRSPMTWGVALASALSLLGPLPAQEGAASPAIPAAAKQELDKALSFARVHNKRVLVVFAEEGKDGDLLTKLKRDRVLGMPLRYEFEAVQFTGDAAQAVASAHRCQVALDSRPALLVLDHAGRTLATFATGTFLVDGTLQGKALLERWKPLYCEPVDADQKLAAALAEAKKSGRNVLVRFDSPT